MPEQRTFENPRLMAAFGITFAQRLKAGDVVLLSGPLGAGKTTLARAMLQGLGWTGIVRSPTFNLMQTYATNPPVMHADLYRVESAAGLGLEEFLDSHISFIEWPDRLRGLLEGRAQVFEVDIAFADVGRTVTTVQ